MPVACKADVKGAVRVAREQRGGQVRAAWPAEEVVRATLLAPAGAVGFHNGRGEAGAIDQLHALDQPSRIPDAGGNRL